MRFQHWLSRFQIRIILILIGIVVLTAVAVGIPAVVIIRSQLNRQAWAQVYQGIQAADVLYDAQQKDLENLALLTAQRPTLLDLLNEKNPDKLSEYLITLQQGTVLDLIAICDSSQIGGTATREIDLGASCQIKSKSGFQMISSEGVSGLWLTSARPISGTEYLVIVGREINDQFAAEISEKIGLDHLVWVGGKQAASSLIAPHTGLIREKIQLLVHPLAGIAEGTRFEILGVPYIASSYLLDPQLNIQGEILLSTADIRETQINLIRILIASISGIAILVSIIGIFTARQISQPLVQLAETAAELSNLNLEETVVVDTTIWEISQVADALEKARRDLWESLSQLKLEKRWVDHLLASIVEGILTLDAKNRITFFSRGAENITGWQSKQVLNQSCNDVFKLFEGELSFSQSIPKPGKRSKMDILLADGKIATLAVTRAELAPTSVRDARAVLVFRDISEEEAVHRILGHFISNIAHEFKTPLSALAASSELLLTQSLDLTPEELQELLISLNLGIVGLQTLIDNLLESASIEAGHFRVFPHPTDLGEIIASAVRTMKPLMNKYHQKLVLDLPVDIPVVWADQRRINQVIVNLLSNAIKYGPDHATITIRVEKDAARAKIKVIDQGPGIPLEERKEIFRRFVRLETGAEKFEAGAGLGLSVVKEIIEAHGGAVGVEGSEKTGTEFFFSLPIYQEGDQT